MLRRRRKSVSPGTTGKIDLFLQNVFVQYFRAKIFLYFFLLRTVKKHLKNNTHGLTPRFIKR